MHVCNRMLLYRPIKYNVDNFGVSKEFPSSKYILQGVQMVKLYGQIKKLPPLYLVDLIIQP